MNYQGAVVDRTYRDACLPQRVGAHDEYEPTTLDRVYVLLDRAACQVKIGWTTRSVELRKRDIERTSGRTLELIGTMRGGFALEQAMHNRFRKHRREYREWYSSEILIDLIPLLDG